MLYVKNGAIIILTWQYPRKSLGREPRKGLPMKRFRSFFLFLAMIIVVCLLTACGSAEKPETQVELFVQGDESAQVVYAYQTIGEAEKYKASLYLQPTGWGWNQRAVKASITGKEQNIISCKIRDMIVLQYSEVGFDTAALKENEFVKTPSRSIQVEAWIDREKTPNTILEIVLEDQSVWYAIVHAR